MAQYSNGLGVPLLDSPRLDPHPPKRKSQQSDRRRSAASTQRVSNDSLQRVFQQMGRDDPALVNDLSALPLVNSPTQQARPTAPTSQADPSSSLANLANALGVNLKRAFSKQGIEDSAKLITDSENSVGRGALRSVDVISNSLVAASIALSKASGLYKWGRSDAEQRAFLRYADLPTEQENPFLIGHDRIDQLLGPKQKGELPATLEAAGSLAVFAAIPHVP